MSFVGTLLPIALVAASWVTPASTRNMGKCSLQCDEVSFCDNFENKCKPCQEICSDLEDCKTSCPHYLANIVHHYSSHKLQPDQLHVLTIMVALTAVMTSVIMAILMFFMFLKMKKRKRLAKKINPSVLFNVDKEKIDLSETKMEKLSAKGLVKGERQESINTMMTQLSNNSSNQSDNFPTGPMRNSKTSVSLNNRARRLPSEDCVPNFGRINPGLDSANTEMSPRDHSFQPSRQYCEVVWRSASEILIFNFNIRPKQ